MYILTTKLVASIGQKQKTTEASAQPSHGHGFDTFFLPPCSLSKQSTMGQASMVWGFWLLFGSQLDHETGKLSSCIEE